jgi:hypothetical protein
MHRCALASYNPCRDDVKTGGPSSEHDLDPSRRAKKLPIFDRHFRVLLHQTITLH